MAEMTLSAAGMALVQEFEGLRLTAYKDGAGVLTIGYGHTGRDVHPGQVITEQEAKALLVADLHAAVVVVNRSVKVPLTQNQFDACVDFVYNAGTGAFILSTLLKDINAGNFTSAATQFGRWVHAGGAVENGLVRRRAAEAALFAKAA